MKASHAGRWRRGLYFLTAESSDTHALVLMAGEAIAGGAVMLQYRSKIPDPALRRAQAHALSECALAAGVPLIVNDDVALALEVGAAGVHLGRGDSSVAQARARLGDAAIIGASCYDSLALAVAARAAGANYVAFGAMYPSATKPEAITAPQSLLRESAGLGLPRVAIGGINLDNAKVLVDAGADLVAVISAISNASDPRGVAARFADLF